MGVLRGIFSGQKSAQTYYVSPTGDDANDGLSSADSHAWLTMQHAADNAQGSDTVIFAAGTYAGAKFHINSGGPGVPVVFQAADGATVLIHREPSAGADNDIIAAGHEWVNISGNKWRSQSNSVVGTGAALFRDDTLWFAKSNFSANITSHGTDPWFFYDSTNKRVEVNSPTDPSLNDWVVIGSSSNKCVWITGVNYLTFDGLIFEYAFDGARTGAGNFANTQANNINFNNCAARYNGRRGFAIEGEPLAHSSNVTLDTCTTYLNGEHGVKQVDDVTTDGSVTMSNLTITACTAHDNGYHGFQVSNGSGDIIVTGCTSYDNGRNANGVVAVGGEGAASDAANYRMGSTLNGHLYSNISYCTTAVSVGSVKLEAYDMGNTRNVVYEKNIAHGPFFSYFHSSDSGSIPTSNTVIKNNYCYADANGGAVHGTRLSNSNSYEFYNNVFDGNTTDVLNVVGTNTSPIIFKNNVVICATGVLLVSIPSTSTMVSDYNAFYCPDASPFSFNGSAYSFTDYKTASENDANSVLSDFTSEFGNYATHDYSIDAGASTLKDAGVAIASVTDDYLGTARPIGAGYSIGAYEA